MNVSIPLVLSLFNYLYDQKYYNLISIDLPRQTNTSIPQKINFVGKLEGTDSATMFFAFEKQIHKFEKNNINNITSKKLNWLNEKVTLYSWQKSRTFSMFNKNANYGVRNEIIYNTEVLKSNLCD